MNWLQFGPTFAAAFLASLVECIEALTVVLAVIVVRGWRDAVAGSSAAVLILSLIVAAFRPTLAWVPLRSLQLIVGSLLLLFGMRWLRKAILRSAGIVAMHDEAKRYAEEREAMRLRERSGGGMDTTAFSTAFEITLLEGLEVVFIVIALGTGGRRLLIAASLGGFAAFLVIVAFGVALQRPLSRIPENTLKLIVGILLSAFGTFWVEEGFALKVPGQDWSIFGLIVSFFATACLAIRWAARTANSGAASDSDIPS